MTAATPTSKTEAIGVVAFVLGIVLVLIDFASIFINAAFIRSGDYTSLSTVSFVMTAIAVVLALTAVAVGVVACLRGGATRVYGAIGTTVGSMVLLEQFGTLIYALIVNA
ncbi:hypothetical protein [Agromyces italicus]|uniref:hypothetical protein n=1 Tax=Agromyces italicus TaxID=279572 RepID=UPI0003B736A6|nr:hypothetical protein [Agromyces italicus]